MDNTTPQTPENQPELVRPPVNYLQLVSSLLVILLVASNLVTWLHFRHKLAGSSATASTSVSEAPANPASPAPQPPLENVYRITNGHDHLYKLEHLDKYLAAAETLGVTRTLFVASSEFTFEGKGAKDKLNDWSSKEILTAAKKHPGKIIPFVTLHPDDPAKIELLKGYMAEGAMGLKLYTGHSNFYDRKLDADEMMPVYAFCEENGLPIVWHINMDKYGDEFERVMEKHPKMYVLLPHFGVGFWKPEGKVIKQMEAMLAKYPNLYVDTSFGTREILVGGLEKVSDNPDIFKEFYRKNQDRIVWGTDMVVTGNSEKTQAWITSVIRACRDLHEKDHYTFWMAAQGSKYAYAGGKNIYGEFRGLGLPPEILKKIYETNIDKLLAGLKKP
ncbi:MAG: amidohydrolase family protein [Candidatus Hydrogenedentes bacterium]|nr:amidohydrolase family protein [Candidatus Hydrogenedentota bacterium]